MKEFIEFIGKKYYYITQILVGKGELLGFSAIDISSRLIMSLLAISIIIFLISFLFVCVAITIAMIIYYFFNSITIAFATAVLFVSTICLLILAFRKRLILIPLKNYFAKALTSGSEKRLSFEESKNEVERRLIAAKKLNENLSILEEFKASHSGKHQIEDVKPRRRTSPSLLESVSRLLSNSPQHTIEEV